MLSLARTLRRAQARRSRQNLTDTAPTIWRLRYDLAWAKLLLWVAGAGVVGEPKPEVHAYLATLYYELADEHERRGHAEHARRLRLIARDHGVVGPPPELPPAVAMRMAVPHSPVVTDVRGKSMRPSSSKKDRHDLVSAMRSADSTDQI